MKKIPAFKHNLYSFNIHSPEIDQLKESLDNMFNHPKIKYGHYRGEEMIGHGRSTISTPNSINSLPGMDFLLKSVKDCIRELDPSKTKEKYEIVFENIWTNRNFKGSTVKVHRHPESLENVCIFYIDVPEEGCADLVVLEKGVTQTPLSDYPEDTKIYINVSKGDLIIHKPNVLHAVSEHKSDYPRTCIILNYFMKEIENGLD